MYTRNQSTVTEFILAGLSSDPLVQRIFFVFLLVAYMITLVGNSLIIVAVRTDKRLHTSMYFFLCNLSFLDICYSTTIIPKTLENCLSLKKSISFTGCAIQYLITVGLGGIECLLLAFMAYDRYVAICNPLHYTRIMNIKVSMCLNGSLWLNGCIISSVGAFIVFNLTFCGPNIINHFYCELPLMLRLACNDLLQINILQIVSTPTFFFIPLSFIIISYVRIIVTVLSMNLEKNKAFSTCFSHLVVVCIIYGPAIFMYTRPYYLVSEVRDKYVALFYTVISPMLNPLIYSLRNKDVKRAMRRLVRVL